MTAFFFQAEDGIRDDFARYGERLDEKGESDIQLWVPVI